MTARRHARWLWFLLGLFCFRVAAQGMQTVADVAWLPHFEAWHSAVLPYRQLLFAQLLIIAFYASLALRFSMGRIVPSRRAGKVWLALGLLYGALMAARLAIGLLVASSPRWFHSHISIFFHFVLAAFLLVVASFHRGWGAPSDECSFAHSASQGNKDLG